MLNTFCPGRGSNQDLLRGSQTLYRVAIKDGLYGKAVQVCIMHLSIFSPRGGGGGGGVDTLGIRQQNNLNPRG